MNVLLPLLWYKKNGGIKTCGDFELNINLVFIAEQHPLLLLDHLFSGLSGGQKYGKIDLSQAYLQLQLD